MPIRPKGGAMTARHAIGETVHDGQKVLRIARRWISTPYRHQASARGAGADCLGLIRGIWRELNGREPVEVPVYSADWLELGSQDRLADALAGILSPVTADECRTGDVLMFAFGRNRLSKHLGILAVDDGGSETFIHAYSRYGVAETSLDPCWRRRISGIFRFPIRSN